MTIAKRPSGRLRDFATNPNYSAGADPWSGQPTKVRPSDGVMQAGVIPNTQPLARHENFNRWEERRYLALLDGLEVNFLDTAIVGTVTGNQATGVACGVWRADRPLFVTAASDPDIWVATDDRTFTSSLTLVGGSWAHLAEGPYSTAAVGSSGAGDYVAAVGEGDPTTWYTRAMTDCLTLHAVVVDPDNDEIIAVGENASGSDPAVWTVSDPDHGGPTFAAASFAQISRAGSQALQFVARGPVYRVASGTTELSYWQRGDATLTADAFATSLGAHTIKGLVYDDENALFLVLTSDGTNSKVWRWSPGVFGPTEQLAINGLVWATGKQIVASRGACIMAATTSGTLVFSYDAFVSYRRVPDPCLRFDTAPVGPSTLVTLCDNRFIVGDYHAAGDVRLAYGIRLGQLFTV